MKLCYSFPKFNTIMVQKVVLTKINIKIQKIALVFEVSTVMSTSNKGTRMTLVLLIII